MILNIRERTNMSKLGVLVEQDTFKPKMPKMEGLPGHHQISIDSFQKDTLCYDQRTTTGRNRTLALAVRRYILIGISESDNQIKMAKYVWLILLYTATQKIWMSSII